MPGPGQESVWDYPRQPAEGHTVCEYTGAAPYLTLVAAGSRAESAAWFYPNPRPGYAELADRIAVYPGRVVGPFTGEPGSLGW